MDEATLRFPEIRTKDLNGREVVMPDELEGELNLLVLAYEQYQQAEVDTWVPVLEELERLRKSFFYYEVPMPGPLGSFQRIRLDGWMKMGIRDERTRARTLTLYVDRASIREPLGIESESTIALVLVDRSGAVVWKALGPRSSAVEASLRTVMRENV
jgi:hypothetical protein